jgi:carboxylate-amine ligase
MKRDDPSATGTPGAMPGPPRLEPWTTSAPLTLGVELELQLVHRADLDLTAASPDLLELLGRKPFPGQVVPEITESMIEIATGIHTTHAGLLAQLREIRSALLAAGDRLNVGIAGGGTHPFQRWNERRIFGRPRFHEVSRLYGYLAHQFTVFGQHVHVGCESGDRALVLLHSLARYVPHFIALAAASPFVQGSDTLFHSARLNSVFAFPLSGRAPFCTSWREFEEGYFAKMAGTGIVKSMKDFYWDIRPKPEYGTIELRVCDTPLTVERAAALAGYLQVLCAALNEGLEPPPAEDDYLTYHYNRFQACRFGLEGLVVPRGEAPRPIAEDIATTIQRLRPWAPRLQASAALDEVEAVLRLGNDARFLRAAREDSGSLEGVVEAAMKRFRGSRGEG